jgi:CheY-like chemotaxis protein
MATVELIHWKTEEAPERLARLRAAGFSARHVTFNGPATLKALAAHLPAVVVIDLSRLPSHGRDVALALRTQKATRGIPLVFVEGEPEKVAAIKKLLPDAAYTSWARIATVLRKVIARPPKNPVVPASVLAGYSGTPLVRKLGIKAGFDVALFGAPENFPQTVGALPEGVRLRAGDSGRANLRIWFVRSAKELSGGIRRIARLAGDEPIWFAWPKKTSALACDISETDIRREGLAHGLVDYKICAIDATWSGLLFRRRKQK